jgi:hypothetical protein
MVRRGSIFWGIILILAAVLLWLQDTGRLPGSLVDYLGPLLLVALGIWLILGTLPRAQPSRGEELHLSLEGAASASLRFDHGLGHFNLSSGARPGELLSGAFGGGVYATSTLKGDFQLVRLRTPHHPWGWMEGEGLDWDVHLCQDIPLSLKIDSGASSSILDLTELKVRELSLDTGASTTSLTLPGNAGSTQVDIDTGVSSLTVHVPEGVAARIRLKVGLSAVRIAERFVPLEHGLYQSADFEQAANRIDLTIDAGVGSVEIV